MKTGYETESVKIVSPLMYWTLAAFGMSSRATHTLPICEPSTFQ